MRGQALVGIVPRSTDGLVLGYAAYLLARALFGARFAQTPAHPFATSLSRRP